jgi:hypothetical protein
MLRRAAFAFLTTFLCAAPAMALEPWSEDDGLNDRKRHEFGNYGFTPFAEYRSNWLYVRPLNLNGTNQRNANWIEHRLRIEGAIDYDNKVRLVMSMDGLDGVLWGDNGTYLGNPSTVSGSRAGASLPNTTVIGVGYQGSGSNIDPENYGLVVKQADPLNFRRAYGELMLPVGFLRIGRQPTTEGTSILASDGDGRPNRFGYSYKGETSDRILFATKPLEALKPESQRDKSRDNGYFLIGFYDNVVEARPQIFGDNLRGAGTAMRWLQGPKDRRIELQGTYAHRWERSNDTDVDIFSFRAVTRVGKFTAGGEFAHVRGGTEEVSRALALINNDPIVRQQVRQYGARVVTRWDEPKWTAYLEFDFASADRNPNPGTQLGQLYFSRDMNVGLLMFERVLQFQTARAGVAGTELLRQIGAASFPNERIDTRGSFTNAVAIFPQFDLKPIPNVLFRGGVLAAWAPSGLVDPLGTLQRRDGVQVEDDLRNYNGGRPGTFYGVEIDGKFQWKWHRFLFDLESAVLFPGDVFHDENGRAANSFMTQGRTTWVF